MHVIHGWDSEVHMHVIHGWDSEVHMHVIHGWDSEGSHACNSWLGQ